MAFDWSGIGSAVAGGVAGWLGNDAAAGASKKALKFQKEMYRDAQKERQRGRKASLALVSPYFDSGAADAMIGRAMTSRPEVLTPSEEIALQDLNRRTLNNLSVAGMRGAGRGGQAVLADTTRRFLADAFDRNQARSDQAANTIASRGERARGTGANIETGAANAMASDAANFGQDAAGHLLDQGAASTANFNLLGNTIGAITQLANQDRSYDKYGSGRLSSTEP